MSDDGEPDLGCLLEGVNAGHAGAVDALSEAIHDHLRAMARRHLVRDFGPRMRGVTVQPKMVANDTLMKLIRQRQQFGNTGHVFAIASRLMKRVLLDYHRAQGGQARGQRGPRAAGG